MSRLRIMLALTLLVGALAAPATTHGELHVSTAGVRMIERFEGFVPSPRPDPVGVETVGFGITSAVVDPLPAHLTRRQAEALLRRVLDRVYVPPLRALFGGTLRAGYTSARLDSLASATFNLGRGLVECAPGFGSMCAALRSRDAHRIGAALLRYDHAAGAVLPGLFRRRHIEAAPWLRAVGRFEDYTPLEAHLIRAVDQLAGHRSTAAHERRRRLQHAIRVAARHVARAARATRDWLSQRRSIRYAALMRRA